MFLVVLPLDVGLSGVDAGLEGGELRAEFGLVDFTLGVGGAGGVGVAGGV